MTSLADDTRWLDALGQAGLVADGSVSASELVDAAIERIERLDPAVNAVVIRWFDHARQVAAGPLPAGPFRGVPFLLKDLWAAYEGQLLSNGNRALKAAAVASPADTTLVARHRLAGLVTLGRTNSPEFGSLPTTEPEAWGPTRNPWDTSRTPGGSSGGSAAAVAAGMVPIAHASDGGGSIRIPASCCGLVGLKVSQGRMSLGPQRDESALGVEHCVTRTVRDTAALLDATCGPGVGDTVIAPAPSRPYADEVGTDPGRLRVGVLARRPDGGAVDPECEQAARQAGTLLEGLGHHVEESSPAALADPDFGRQFAALWATQGALAIARSGEIAGHELTEDDVEAVNWAQARVAERFSAVHHAMALAATARFRRAVQQWWADGWDLLVTPTVAEPPPALGTFANNPDDPLAPMARASQFVPFTPAFNATGQPAISLPLHRSASGLPVGVQLVAAYGREDVLVRVAAQLEAAVPWAHHVPKM